jgi:hypothetical protein
LQFEASESKNREDVLVQQQVGSIGLLVKFETDQSQGRRPFVLVLIDADADGFLVRSSHFSHVRTILILSQFHDKYITKKAQGGEALADEILIRTREYLRPQYEDADTLDIIVRVYANLEGMANYLVRLDKVRNLGSLRAFSTGFCGRISSFDWVDTGVGKEGSSGRKVRGKQSLLECVVM